MNSNIIIENGKLVVNHFETSNKDIVSYFSDIPEDEMLGEVCSSCASIMNDKLEFEC